MNERDFSFVDIFICTNEVQIGISATFKSSSTSNAISQVTTVFEKFFNRTSSPKKVTIRDLIMYLSVNNWFNELSPEFCFVNDDLVSIDTSLSVLLQTPMLLRRSKVEIVVNNHCRDIEDLYTMKSRLLFGQDRIPNITLPSDIVVEVLPFNRVSFSKTKFLSNIDRVTSWFKTFQNLPTILTDAVKIIIYGLEVFRVTSGVKDTKLFILSNTVASALNDLTQVSEESSIFQMYVILFTQSYKSFLFNAMKLAQRMYVPTPDIVWGINMPKDIISWPFVIYETPLETTTEPTFTIRYNGELRRKVFEFWESPIINSDVLWATLKEMLLDTLKDVCYLRLITKDKIFTPITFMLTEPPRSEVFSSWFKIVQQEAYNNLQIVFDCQLVDSALELVTTWPGIKYSNSITTIARLFKKSDYVSFGEVLLPESVELYQDLSIQKLAWIVTNDTPDRIPPFVALLTYKLGSTFNNMEGTPLGACLLYREIRKNEYSGYSVPTIPDMSKTLTKMLQLMTLNQIDISSYNLDTSEGMKSFILKIVQIRQLFIVENLWPFVVRSRKDLQLNLRLKREIYRDQQSLSIMIPELSICSGIWKFNEFLSGMKDNLWVKYGIWQYLLE